VHVSTPPPQHYDPFPELQTLFVEGSHREINPKFSSGFGDLKMALVSSQPLASSLAQVLSAKRLAFFSVWGLRQQVSCFWFNSLVLFISFSCRRFILSLN
jgi:hypothetical protein